MHFWVLNRKVLSRNNGEYDKPLYSISLVVEGEVDGQVKHEFTVSVDRCSLVWGSCMFTAIQSSLTAIYL